jgi:hypothetical protein
MKRRLPMINQSESVLVAINLPPLTAEANLHIPTATQPGSSTAAAQATRIAPSPQAPTSPGGTSTAPPNSTANAEKPTAQRPAHCRKQRHQPRAVV